MTFSVPPFTGAPARTSPARMSDATTSARPSPSRSRRRTLAMAGCDGPAVPRRAGRTVRTPPLARRRRATGRGRAAPRARRSRRTAGCAACRAAAGSWRSPAPIMPAGSGTPSMISCIRTSSSRQAARGRMSGGGNLWQTVPHRWRTSASVATGRSGRRGAGHDWPTAVRAAARIDCRGQPRAGPGRSAARTCPPVSLQRRVPRVSLPQASSLSPMSDAAPRDPAAPRSPVTWLVLGVLMAALMVVAASIYARVEVRRLRDEQVALTERLRLDTLQLIRIDNNVATIEDTLRDMTDRSEPYPLVGLAADVRAAARGPRSGARAGTRAGAGRPPGRAGPSTGRRGPPAVGEPSIAASPRRAPAVTRRPAPSSRPTRRLVRPS